MHKTIDISEMITWTTYIRAICPISGQLYIYDTDIKIEAPTKELALEWAQENGYGYLHIGDKLSYIYDSDTKESVNFEHYLN